MPVPSATRKILLVAALIVAAPMSPAFGQDTAAKTPAFDVASIRQNKTGNGRWRLNFTADGLTATGVTLRYVIQEAYRIYDDRLWSGGPPWLDTTRFDIEAKFDPSAVKNPTADERSAMLQQLLADRFKLAVHHQDKELPVYALVPAKNGPKLRESKAGDVIQGVRGPMCLFLHGHPGDMAVQGCSMADLASSLSLSARDDLGRIVVDRTGLPGRYDFELHWALDSASATDVSGPPLFTALQEQLGLKLEATKAMLDTIVIDHVEPPSEN